MPPLSERTLPLSLWLRFKLEGRDRLLAVLLQFLRPTLPLDQLVEQTPTQFSASKAM